MNRMLGLAIVGSVAAASASAQEQLDLKQQVEQYGYQSLAMIVGAYEASDKSPDMIRRELHSGGLSALRMPLLVGKTLKADVQRHGVVSQCAWSWGVYCQVDVTWTARPPLQWGAWCMRDGKRIGETVFKTVIVPLDKAGRGPVQIDGVQACWALGGNGFELTRVQPTSDATPSSGP